MATKKSSDRPGRDSLIIIIVWIAGAVAVAAATLYIVRYFDAQRLVFACDEMGACAYRHPERSIGTIIAVMEAAYALLTLSVLSVIHWIADGGEPEHPDTEL